MDLELRHTFIATSTSSNSVSTCEENGEGVVLSSQMQGEGAHKHLEKQKRKKEIVKQDGKRRHIYYFKLPTRCAQEHALIQQEERKKKRERGRGEESLVVLHKERLKPREGREREKGQPSTHIYNPRLLPQSSFHHSFY
jgi:hypothetical protein